MDALARIAGDLAAGCRQFLLYGLPLHPDARLGAALVARALALAETTAFQVARRRIAGGLLVGL